MDKKKPRVEDPMIQKLIDSLDQMPEYLRERSRKIAERKRFVREVFESACHQAFGEKNPFER